MINLFKKIKSRIISKNWYDITLGQFQTLCQLGDTPDLADLLRIIYDVDLRTIPVSTIAKYNIEFLKKPIPRTTIKDHYLLNGTKYQASFDLTKLTTAQFFDFRNYAKQNDTVGVLSCCIIPEGHEYNDGYDINTVRTDLLSLPITDAQTISFFFRNQLVILLRSILSYSSQQICKQMPNLTPLMSQLEKLDLNSLTSFHL